MTLGGGGYGVRPEELGRVADVYRSQGDNLLELHKTVTASRVGNGQVGRVFQPVAARYSAALEAIGATLAAFGNRAVEVNLRLRDVAGSYQGQESTNTAKARSIHG